jgi:TPR repeat protein
MDAATNDEVDTLLELARISDYEPGCISNPEKAFQYCKQAAELGSPYAQYCVAACYADGFGWRQMEK